MAPAGVGQVIFGTNMVLKVYTLAERLLHSASKIVTHPGREISPFTVYVAFQVQRKHVRAVWAHVDPCSRPYKVLRAETRSQVAHRQVLQQRISSRVTWLRRKTVDVQALSVGRRRGRRWLGESSTMPRSHPSTFKTCQHGQDL